MDPVVLHRFVRGLGLHELVKPGKVGDLDDQPNALRSLRVPKCASGDSERSEHLLALGRAQPVGDAPTSWNAR